MLASGKRIGVRDSQKEIYTCQKYMFWMLLLDFPGITLKLKRKNKEQCLKEQHLLTCHM